MKRWALVTVLLYALILILIAGPVVLVAFYPEYEAGDILKGVYTNTHPLPRAEVSVDSKTGVQIMAGWSLWGWVGLMVLAQVAMLVVPVRIAGERIVSTKWLFWPFLAAFIMLLVLAWSMYLALSEVLSHTPSVGRWTPLIAFGVVFFVWSLWALLFGFYTAKRDARTKMSRLVRFLVAGSVLELLVAVPAHVVARSRSYCCAGFGTFWGIAAGISVMLFAFGPAVFVLFARRFSSVYEGR